MADNRLTIFQYLNRIFGGKDSTSVSNSVVTSVTPSERDEVLFTTRDKTEYETKLKALRQQKYLSWQWKKAEADNSMESLAGYNAIKLMYRDVDLMDGTCEIGSALDIISEEVVCQNSEGQIVHVYSRSQRTKSILEDLFINRLHIYTELQMVARHLCKYGNTFMLLNIDKDNGIMGWMMLPVYEVDRVENGYGALMYTVPNLNTTIKPDEVKFVWRGNGAESTYFNWQVAHFRLLNDSFFLPYGCIVGDSRIETEHGYKEIDSIEIGDKVWTFDIDKQEKILSTVSMTAFKGVKDVYMLKTKHNFIEATDDHKFLCYENEELTYKELKDIKIGDLIVVDNSINKQNEQIKIDKTDLTENEANFKKSIQCRKNNGFKTEKITSKEYVGKKKTYDITVDNDNSNFFANGIVTHNCSLLHKARRAWRMWSIMEDAMLIWRLDKAVERRVFKIYVGAIDDADVPAYINEIANNFKRTPIIDPATGQVDLRKAFPDVTNDFFIPVRREDAPTPIDTLASANSQVQMEDIEYMQNKILTALRVPKTFLNFQEAQGKGQNLAFLDVRFARMINRIQQYIIMELNKIACIHLYMLGLKDEIGNFTITLNNPSNQIESQELEDLQKRLTAMQTALADPGNGSPMLSMHKALKDIMKMSDSEIKDMLNEIRLEKAMAAELENTANIIKHTGIFDVTDRIYGDYESMHGGQQPMQGGGEDDMGGGMPGGGGFSGGFGGDLGGDDSFDIGEPGAEETGDLGGATGETDMGNAPSADSGAPLMEQIIKKNNNKIDKKATIKSFTERYFDMLSESQKKSENEEVNEIDFEIKNKTIQENIQRICDKIETLVDEDEIERENLITDTLNDLKSVE